MLLTITTSSKENEEKLINFFDTFLIALIKLLKEFPEYTIINNKILEIFKLISEKNLAIAKSPLISSLKEILTENKNNLESIAQLLLKKEVLYPNEVKEILGEEISIIKQKTQNNKKIQPTKQK